MTLNTFIFEWNEQLFPSNYKENGQQDWYGATTAGNLSAAVRYGCKWLTKRLTNNQIDRQGPVVISVRERFFNKNVDPCLLIGPYKYLANTSAVSVNVTLPSSTSPSEYIFTFTSIRLRQISRTTPCSQSLYLTKEITAEWKRLIFLSLNCRRGCFVRYAFLGHIENDGDWLTTVGLTKNKERDTNIRNRSKTTIFFTSSPPSLFFFSFHDFQHSFENRSTPMPFQCF